jgi:hypothetical protein
VTGEGVQSTSTGTVTPVFRRTIADLFKARFPFLYVQTWEEDRVVSEVAAVVSDPALIKTRRNLYVWSSTTGLAAPDAKPRSGSADPAKALELVEQLDEPAVFVFKDFHSYLGAGGRTPDPQIVRKVRGLVSTLKNARCPKNVLFVSPTIVLPLELQKDISVLDFEMPSFEEIARALQDIIAVSRPRFTGHLCGERDDHATST